MSEHRAMRERERVPSVAKRQPSTIGILSVLQIFGGRWTADGGERSRHLVRLVDECSLWNDPGIWPLLFHWLILMASIPPNVLAKRGRGPLTCSCHRRHKNFRKIFGRVLFPFPTIEARSNPDQDDCFCSLTPCSTISPHYGRRSPSNYLQ